MSKVSNVALMFCAFALVVAHGNASIIDFEDQPPGPSTFGAAGPEQTLVYTIGSLTAEFTGGVILTGETNQTTDVSNVYATASFGDASLTNPLVINFSQPIHNFQIDILNAIAGSYTMADNVGDSVNFNLATTGGSIQTEGFAAAGTQVTIAFNGPAFDSNTQFDFAIDNVLFNQPLTTTPEPSAIPLLGAAIVAIIAIHLRKKATSRGSIG